MSHSRDHLPCRRSKSHSYFCEEQWSSCDAAVRCTASEAIVHGAARLIAGVRALTELNRDKLVILQLSARQSC